LVDTADPGWNGQFEAGRGDGKKKVRKAGRQLKTQSGKVKNEKEAIPKRVGRRGNRGKERRF